MRTRLGLIGTFLLVVWARAASAADLPELLDVALEPLATAAVALQAGDRATAAARVATVDGLGAAAAAGSADPAIAAALGRKARVFRKRVSKLRKTARRAFKVLGKPKASDAAAMRALRKASGAGSKALRFVAGLPVPGILVMEEDSLPAGFHLPGEAVTLVVIARDETGNPCPEPVQITVVNLFDAVAVDPSPTDLGGGRFSVTMGNEGGAASIEAAACGRTARPGRLLFNEGPVGTGGPPGGGTWTLTEIMAGDDVGHYPQVALDAAGVPHVVSMNFTFGAETYDYSTRPGSIWTTEEISTAAQACGGNVGVLSDIAVDGSGLPHVSLEVPDQAVQYAFRSGAWTVTDVSTTICPYGGPSPDQAYAFVGHNAIAIDRPSDTLWIVGWFWNGISQRYAVAAWRRGDPATMQIDEGTVGGDTYTGRYPSVAVDATGAAHVVYEGYTDTGSLIRYARWNGGAFVTDTVADIGNANSGRTAVVVVDSADRPHVVYFDPGEGYKHAAWNGAGWDLEVITSDDAPAGQAWMDVAVAGSDELHVVYYRTGGSVRYTHGASGSWSATEMIAADGETPSIAVTAGGTPHVVFRETLSDRLVHATR
jgi:hypothetical protein